MTYAQFNAAVRAAVNADGESENLVTRHKSWILDALIDLQTKVPRLQRHHTDYIAPQSTFFHCSASVFDVPRGFISTLTTIVPGSSCCKEITYMGCSKNEMDCMLSTGECCAPCGGELHPYPYYVTDGTLYVPYPELPLYCFEYPDSNIDRLCRASEGYFTLYRGQLWMTPHLQSFEVAKLEWDGVKRTFDDADELDEELFDREVQECVELYLTGRQASIDDCDYTRGILFNNENPSKFGMYQVRRADLIHTTEKEKRLPPRNYCFDTCRNGGLFLPAVAGTPSPGPSASTSTVPQVFFGSGDPNGVQTATAPALFYTDTGAIWFKTNTGTNNIGWEMAIGG